MKTTSFLRKLLQPVLATLAIAIVSGLSVSSAQANYIVTLQQVGSNVVATGTGAINLTGLTLAFANDDTTGARMFPQFFIIMGSTASGFTDSYTGFIGPPNFGSGGLTPATIGSGDHVGINFGASNRVYVPVGYSSGTLLSDMSTYNNASFASLDVTPARMSGAGEPERIRTSPSRLQCPTRVQRLAYCCWPSQLYSASVVSALFA